MSLLTRIKSLLGLDGSGDWDSDEPAAVAVEREPDTPAEDSGPIMDQSTETESPASTDEAAAVPEEPEAPTVDTSAPEAEADEPAPEEESTDPVTDIQGIGPTYGERLEGAGIITVGELAGADAARLAGDTDIAQSRIERWIEVAAEWDAE